LDVYLVDATVTPFTDVSIKVLTQIIRAYLTEQSMDHLSATLKKGGIKDLLSFFPANKREGKYLEDHFKTEGLPQVAEWWTKKQYTALKESLIKDLSDMIEHEDTVAQVFHGSPSLVRTRNAHQSFQIASAIKARQAESSLPESELVQCLWQGLMSSVDWSSRPDQIEGLALREVTVRIISFTIRT